MQTKSLGIFQGDIVIRTAIIMGLREIRANPLLLDYCFAWLPNDELTAEQYGLKTVEQAKKWFLNTDIGVALDVRIGQAKLPMVVITLGDSQEREATLGDVHYDPSEDGPEEGQATNLESVKHHETYTIGLYVEGEPLFLLFLYSIILFVLYRYKQDFLEARGFEVSVIQAGRLEPFPMEGRENVFSRPLSISGSVRHYWPKKTALKLTSVDTRLVVEESLKKSVGVDLSDPAWMLEEDVLGAGPTDAAVRDRVIRTTDGGAVTSGNPSSTVLEE